ncbi:MAG: hypothetical protein AAB353_05695 [Candidatus Hydrogenedentota bacterium]
MKTCFGIIILAVFLQGCGRTGVDGFGDLEEAAASPAETLPAYQKWDPAFVDQLKAKANALAERELGRMAATEMLYRNVVELQTPGIDQLPDGTGAWVKIYRSFEGYEIKDIVRSDSYLSPIEYEIEYRYTIFSTRPLSQLEADGAARAAKDSFFDPLAVRTVSNTYKCDAWGNVVGDFPNLLDRVNYFTRDVDWRDETGYEKTINPFKTPEMREMVFGGAQGFPPVQIPNQPPFPQEAPQPQ